MWRQDDVVVRAFARLRVGVDQGRSQARQRVQQAVLSGHGNLMRRDGAGIWVHDDFTFGPELKPQDRTRAVGISHG